MKLTDHFFSQLERETPATRTALERVPVGRNDWKPHEKSMPLGSLASLVATMPSWIGMVIEMDKLDIGLGGAPALPQTNRELLEQFDKSLAAARRALKNTTDEHLMTSWKLLYKGRVLSDTSRYEMLTDGVFSHLAHHRGQLTVYLRLNGVPVPPIYGATADEGR